MRYIAGMVEGASREGGGGGGGTPCITSQFTLVKTMGPNVPNCKQKFKFQDLALVN